MSIITAHTEQPDGKGGTVPGSVSFVVADPPTASDLERWVLVARYIPTATWTASPGDTIVPARAKPKK